MRVAKSKRRPAATRPSIVPIALRIAEAEQISGLSRTTLYRLRRDGQLIFRKAGRTVLVDYNSLKAAIAACLPRTPAGRSRRGDPRGGVLANTPVLPDRLGDSDRRPSIVHDLPQSQPDRRPPRTPPAPAALWLGSHGRSQTVRCSAMARSLLRRMGGPPGPGVPAHGRPLCRWAERGPNRCQWPGRTSRRQAAVCRRAEIRDRRRSRPLAPPVLGALADAGVAAPQPGVSLAEEVMP